MLSINASPKAAATLAEATRTEDVCMTKDGTRLVGPYEKNSSVIHCFRSRPIQLDRFNFEPY
jgi:hypothetical protein